MNLKSFKEEAVKANIPVIRDESERLLLQKIAEVNPENILEIGTAVGYSGVSMLLNSNAKLTTIEFNEERYNLAKENFEKFNCLNRVTQVLGDAGEFLENNNEMFDFIFLDGPKGQYVKYLPNILRALKKGGILFCDNVLFKGYVLTKIIPPKKYRTIVRNLRQFLDDLNDNENLETKIYHIEDGVSVSKRID